MPISACTSRSGRSRGSSTASGLEGACHCIRRFTRAGPFWPHFLGEADWRSTGCTASWCHRLCSISNLKEIPFCVMNEICDDRCQDKCGLISTLAIALFRTSRFTVILFCTFRPQRKPHLLRRWPNSARFVFQLLIDRHDFSY